jgi:hypothetical protein
MKTTTKTTNLQNKLPHPTMHINPFPPPQGPTPWTAKQKADYAKQQRQQLPTAPF